ncbi:cyanophycinase [Aliidiomarina minuta]|uniref:Cyanophycinase n=1 Tax=Aliidiomarina minuta TaxID=880057 RepID=A0A432W3R0_9GAMM|nr:cyanophycinase [Aliidiomarina minuta]RUO23909.1 cyanophycinase [Aliidiomarina minuta]
MKNTGMQWVAVLSLLLGVSFTASADDDNEPNWNLMLMGNEPQICSSMNQDACSSKDWIQANDMRTARLFNLSDVRRKEAMRRAIWPRERDEIRDRLTLVLEEMADYFGYGVVPEYRFVDRLRSRAYLDLLSEITEAEYNRLLDSLEMPRLKGLNEEVNLAETKGSSANLLREFVAMAAANSGNEEPLILVVTASARDSFRDIELYQQAFAAAGAQVKWLPVDATLNRAQREGLCESLDSLRRSTTGNYDRARVYPNFHRQQQAFCTNKDAWKELVAEADALFINDGNQSLTRQTFFLRDDEPTELLVGIHAAMRAGELVVGGAGAGAVAMSSGTMVTSGNSREAMKGGSHARRPAAIGCEIDGTCPRGLGTDSLTYHAMGGLGLYPYGVIDTEVSERGRQARMLRLAADTATPLAMGIDRDTALFMNTDSGQFAVRGSGGVIMLESSQGNENMVAGNFHFLRHKSSGRISHSGVSDILLAEQSRYRPESTTTRFLGDTGVYDNLQRLCEGRPQVQLLQEDFSLLMQRTDDTEFKPTQGRCQVTNATIGVAWQPEEQR